MKEAERMIIHGVARVGRELGIAVGFEVLGLDVGCPNTCINKEKKKEK